MDGMQDLPVFIICVEEFAEVVIAENVHEALDSIDEKYPHGCRTIYTPESCPDDLWALVSDAVDQGYGSINISELD